MATESLNRERLLLAPSAFNVRRGRRQSVSHRRIRPAIVVHACHPAVAAGRRRIGRIDAHPKIGEPGSGPDFVEALLIQVADHGAGHAASHDVTVSGDRHGSPGDFAGRMKCPRPANAAPAAGWREPHQFLGIKLRRRSTEQDIHPYILIDCSDVGSVFWSKGIYRSLPLVRARLPQ